MQPQKLYAIVKKSARKYRHDLRCPLLESQLPIFWNKEIAENELKERGIKNECEVVRVNLIEAE